MDSTAANLPAQTSTPSTENMPAASLRERSNAALTRAIRSAGDEGYVADRTRVILKLYYDPDMAEHDRAEMIESYVRVLGKVPKWAVAQAFNEWEANGKRRPSPADLYDLAESALAKITRESASRKAATERAEHETEKTFDQMAAAARDLIKNGFTDKRFNAVKTRRMAGSEAELYADERKGRIPHWTERPTTDAAMADLERSRAANPMMAAARRASKDHVDNAAKAALE